MIRHFVLLVAVLSLASLVGCGLINSEIAKTQAFRPGSVTRTFDVPAGRVMFAALELKWDEITWNDSFDFDLSTVPMGKASTLKPVNDEFVFDPEDVRLGPNLISGKTKNGRAVNVWLRPMDGDKKTEVTVLIGKLGDPEFSNALLDKIADRLAHPPVRTPEETEKRKIRVPVVSDATFESGKILPKLPEQP